MTRLRCIAIAIALMGTGGCSKLKFSEFKSVEHKFSIQMPGEPQKETEKRIGLTVTRYFVRIEANLYEVMVVDVIFKEPLELKNFATAIAEMNQGSISKENDWSLDGIRGKEVELKLNQGEERYSSSRLISVNGRGYILQVIGAYATLDNPYVKTFFTSFKTID